MLKILPKRLYPCTKLNGVTILNSMTLIFNIAVTLKCRDVLPCFSFPVQLTQSVYTHSTALNRHPQNVTADCGEFPTFSERSAVAISWSDRPGVRWRCTHKERCVRCVLWCALETQVVCLDIFMYDFSGVAIVFCRHTFHQLLQQTDRHTPRLYIVCVCVCDTALPRLATLTFKNRASYI